MVNKEDFAKRLKKLLNSYEISAASLADKIGIQRSSISHLLSGRNNPSLDFVIKILDNYPEISFDWLVKGIGKMNSVTDYKLQGNREPSLFDPIDIPKEPKTKKEATSSRIAYSEKKIEKIVLLYSDGTFKNYIP